MFSPTFQQCILTSFVGDVNADVGVSEAGHTMKLAVTGVVHPICATHDLVVTFAHGGVPADTLSLAKNIELTDATDVTEDILTRI